MVKELSSRLGCTQTECLHMINTWQDVITDNLAQRDKVMLQGFGTFTCWQQTERLGRNPRTGTPSMILHASASSSNRGSFCYRG